jgi:hypothetical protein
MLNLSVLFTLMMLPGLVVLGTSLIVGVFESKKSASLSRLLVSK